MQRLAILWLPIAGLLKTVVSQTVVSQTVVSLGKVKRMITLLIASAFLSGAPEGLGEPPFLTGGDVSEIPEVEAAGGTYSSRGKVQDPFLLMKNAGWNFIRLRVWNDPKDGFCDKAHTLAMAKRVKAAGMTLSIDFHYSDWWADPGKQNKPAKWRDLSFDALTNAVYDYTKDVVEALIAQGTPPAMVQIGNEVIAGILWPDGKLDGEDEAKWNKLAILLNAGTKGVRDAQGKHRITTMLHIDRGGDNAASRWWFDNAVKHGIEFDTIGQSFYPFWHGRIEDLRVNLNDLASRYRKDVYLVEVAYPWTRDPKRGTGFVYKDDLKTEYPATPQGQADFLKEVIEVVRQMPGGRGKGVLYWAPAWRSTKKNHVPWSNMALFNDQGEALPGVDVLGRAARN